MTRARFEYVRGPTGDQEVSREHREDTRKCVHHSEVSARYEPRQRSDAAHQHEDQLG